MPRSSTTYKITGTKFFRLGSSKILDNWGQNLQNVEKSLRTLYIPDGYEPLDDDIKLNYWLQCKSPKDLSIFNTQELDRIRCFIQVDQAGAEALVVAYLCRHGQYRELFLHNIKPHVFIALHNFAAELKFNTDDEEIINTINMALLTPIKDLKKLSGWKKLDTYIKSTDNWTASKRFYFIAKTICHASNYDAKAPTLQLQTLKKSEGKVVLSKQQAEVSLLRFHALFPEIRDWHNKVRESVLKTKIIYNALSQPITFTGALDESDLKDCFSACPQSTVGVITHIAYTNLYNYINTNNKQWDILNNSHDSYLVQCPLQDIEECSNLMTSLISSIDLVSPITGDHFNMKSEAQFGFNWGPAKDVKCEEDTDMTLELINKYNLNGLREVKI